MHEINHDELDLLPAHLEDLEGMLFVCLAKKPPDFAAARAMMAPILAPQRMAEAKVAKIVDYEVSANWKLVWENNRECYHCNVNHPQYIKANFDHFNSDDTTPRVQERIDAAAISLAKANCAARPRCPCKKCSAPATRGDSPRKTASSGPTDSTYPPLRTTPISTCFIGSAALPLTTAAR
jgi:hypothetical protein